MQFDAMGRPMANIPVTQEGLNARGGYVPMERKLYNGLR